MALLSDPPEHDQLIKEHNQTCTSAVCDILPTFSHTETIALHTFFNFDVINVVFVKEGGKDILYLIVFSLIYDF